MSLRWEIFHFSFFIWILSLGIGFSSCARDSILPVHDEVLTFSIPYDRAFLRTMEAVETHPHWDLEMTDKENGILRIRNYRYTSYADADQRIGTLEIKRLGPRKVSIAFDKDSRAVVGGDEVLKLIKQNLSRETSETS